MGKDLKGKELGVGISQRKDGIYQARYTDRWGQRNTIYNKSIRELRKQLTIAVADDEKKSNIKKDITLDEWFVEWMKVYKEKSIRPNTKTIYTHVYYKNISPNIGFRKINTLVKSDIQKLIDTAYANNYGYERQNKIRVILCDMMQRAVEDQLSLVNPVSGIKIRSEKKVESKALSLYEQNVFFDYCKNTFYENLFNVAINTGMRPGELFALTEKDLDFESGMISVNKTLVYQKFSEDDRKEFHLGPPKTKQSIRNIPMNSVCREFLKKQIELKKVVSSKRPKQENDFLFVTKYNTPLNSQIYCDAIRAVIRQINLVRPFDDQFEDFGGHTFRHTFATRCFENDIDAKVVQSYLGHASIKMTMDLYTHVTDEKSALEIEKIIPPSNVNVVPFRAKIS